MNLILVKVSRNNFAICNFLGFVFSNSYQKRMQATKQTLKEIGISDGYLT